MRDIPDPGFAGDTGRADPELAAALASYAAKPDVLHKQTLAQLQGTARLLVPVMAVLGEAERDDRGLARDKSSDMAAVLMRGLDGRLALLAFTSTASLRAWNCEARPVAVTPATAATAALQDNASALAIDVAGPVLFVVEGDDLRSLAADATGSGQPPGR